MTTSVRICLALCVLFIGILAYVFLAPVSEKQTAVEIPVEEVPQSQQVQSFNWQYEDATTLNLDGVPETHVFLKVTYTDGTTLSQLVDATPGSCNDLPDSETDSAENTTVAQCYAAGLGYRYKFTKGEESYLVMRKMFEEALPDVPATEYDYEVIATFPY